MKKERGNEKLLKEFIAYLLEQVKNKSIYVLGAQGQDIGDITEAWIKKREHNKKSNYERAITVWKARKDKYRKAKAFDCSGLGVYWLKNLKAVFAYDISANGMYRECEKIMRNELLPGDQVFRGNALKKTHIGYVVEILDGIPQIVEAKGRDDGVVKRNINASGSDYWAYYGRPKYFKAEIEAQITNGGEGAAYPKFGYTGIGLNIRSAKTTLKKNVVGFIRTGNTIEKLGQDKKWWKVKLGNVTGWCRPNTKYFKKA